MKKPHAALCLIGLLMIAACTDTQHYPISGEECGPNDPVKTLGSPGCPQPTP